MALVADSPLVVVARKTMPANDLKELIAWLKANADKASQGYAGNGSPGHMTSLLFQNVTGTRVQFVPLSRHRRCHAGPGRPGRST